MISGARRPRARCAVSNVAWRRQPLHARRLLPRTERRSAGWAQPSAMARSLRRIARIDAPLGSPSVTSRRRRPPTAVGSGQAKASASGQGAAFPSGQKLPSSTRRKKRQRRSHGRASRPNLFHRLGGLRQENDGPNVFGCDRSGRGIDFLAASGFNDVSSTGILTYS